MDVILSSLSLMAASLLAGIAIIMQAVIAAVMWTVVSEDACSWRRGSHSLWEASLCEWRRLSELCL